MMRDKLLVLGCLLLPSVSQAAISISEVAWMGSSESANYEWIELYNDGAETDVSGWQVTDGMNLAVELVGVLPPGYSVLERTSDVSAPGTAWQIYTGALVNTGATLRLRDATGNLVDQVAGGENWEAIGGDNVTKETAQYTQSGWVTAPATPGAPPPVSVPEPESAPEPTYTDSQPERSQSKRSSKNVSEPIRLVLPGVTLQVAVEAQTVGYVNQEIAFAAEPAGVGETITNSLTYEWNFGDGYSGRGQEPTHTFRYPGSYVVTVYASYKRQEQVARHEITILPVTTSLTLNAAGDVQIHNESPYEIDVSGYRVRGGREFVFPPRSVILPSQTVTIPRHELGQTKTQVVALYDTAAVAVAMKIPDGVGAWSVAQQADRSKSAAPPELPVKTMVVRPSVSPVVETTVTSPASARFSFASTTIATTTQVTATPNATQLAGAAVAAPAPLTRPHWLLAALLLTVVAGIYLAPSSASRNQSQ